MSEHLFYIRKDATELGPLTLSQLRSMWSRGEVTIKTPYRLEGWNEWKTLLVMQAILEGAPPPPFSTPPPSPPPLAPSATKKKADVQKGCGCAGLIGIVFLFIMLNGPKDNGGLAPGPKDNGPVAISAEEAERLRKLYPSTGVEETGRTLPAKRADDPISVPAVKNKSPESSVQHSAGSRLIEAIKSHLPKPDSFQFVKQISFMDLGGFNQSGIFFSAENESGQRKRYEARSHVSHDGSTVAVVEIQERETGTPIFEDGLDGVKIQLVKARASTWIRDDGEEFTKVYFDWKNVGSTPIRAVKATIRAKDRKGKVIEALSVLSPYYVYVAEDGKGILPGETYIEPKEGGHVLGKVEILKRLGFKAADAQISKAYGKRGLEDMPVKAPTEKNSSSNVMASDLEKEFEELKSKQGNSDEEKLIEDQFSKWDGSHSKLVEVVKKGMNDPSSFEHIETRYWDMKDHLIINMTFVGANAFGGKVKTTVKARSSLKGGDVEIIEMY